MKIILSGGGLDSALTLFWSACKLSQLSERERVELGNVQVQVINYGQVAFENELNATNRILALINDHFERDVFTLFHYNIDLVKDDFEEFCVDRNLDIEPINVSNSTLGGVGDPKDNVDPEIKDRNLSLSIYASLFVYFYFDLPMEKIEVQLSIPSGGQFEDSQIEYYEKYNQTLPFQITSPIYVLGNIRENIRAATVQASRMGKLDLLKALLETCQPCWRPDDDFGCGLCKKCQVHDQNMQFFNNLLNISNNVAIWDKAT